MSISSTLNNALSGLVAASRSAEVVSSNIANAMTDGYGRRDLSLTSVSMAGRGNGVRVDGILRMVDIGLVTDRRAADADLGSANALRAFYTEIERSIGLPGEDGSLNSRLDAFETSLIEAASRPDSQPRLLNVLRAAEGLAQHFNTISDKIQTLRSDADRQIDQTVTVLNTRLQQVADLNRDIRLQFGAGRDASALMDQRQAVIDTISDIVPIREMARDHGEIALITPGGAILVDGKAATFDFAGVGVITPDMTLQSGALGRIAMNGEPIDTAKPHHALIGGALDAQFRIRDQLATAAQAALDGAARDMIERFSAGGLDPSLAAGQPGLFTDGGAAFDPGDEAGVAGRLAVNTAVMPDEGGQIWRLRDGLGAAVPGSVGNASFLVRLTDALQDKRLPPSGGYLAAPRSAAGLASDFLSRMGAERQSAEFNQSHAAAQQHALTVMERQTGVDSDHELQELLLIEQAYAANARVVKAVDEMIDHLLGL